MSLPLHTLTNRHGTLTFTPYGGQVLGYTPTGQTLVLWQTTPEYLEKAYAAGKALRGGIPLCWPWFLAHPSVADAPSHGFARISLWQMEEIQESPSLSSVTLSLATDGSRPEFPYKTIAQTTITLSENLTVSLTTTNLDSQPVPLSMALHTYLAVNDIHSTRVHGLEQMVRQHVSSGAPLPPHAEAFAFTEEVEALYAGVQNPIKITDGQRRIKVRSTAGADAIVWNPWIEKAKTLDMPDESYQQMLCIEAARIKTPLLLEVGGSYTLETTISTD